MDYSIGDKVITKKKHPCGNDVFTIIRTGADVKLKCDRCDRVIMLGLEEFLKRVKKRIEVNNE